MKYMVIENYSDVPENPITIKKGEILTFVEESDSAGDWPDWFFCKGINKEGWIPKQILEVKKDEAIALDDYSANELNLTVGEILISENELNGWIWCRKESDSTHIGWAPLSHLKKI